MGAWQASVARNRLSEIIDQAVAGDPQFIERRDGKEVVVVSRDYFERTKGNLKTFLLHETYAGPGEEEAADEAPATDGDSGAGAAKGGETDDDSK